MKKKIVSGLFLMTLIFASNTFAAQENNVWDMAKSEKYGTKLGGMLGRGLVNVATCFVDLIVHTVEGTQDGPPFVGTLTGLGSGLGCSALRVGSGAVDVVTFWVPGFNGMPVSKSYSNCMEFEEDLQAPVAEATPTVAPVAAPAAAPVIAEPAEAPAPPVREHNAYDYVKK